MSANCEIQLEQPAPKKPLGLMVRVLMHYRLLHDSNKCGRRLKVFKLTPERRSSFATDVDAKAHLRMKAKHWAMSKRRVYDVIKFEWA